MTPQMVNALGTALLIFFLLFHAVRENRRNIVRKDHSAKSHKIAS